MTDDPGLAFLDSHSVGGVSGQVPSPLCLGFFVAKVGVKITRVTGLLERLLGRYKDLDSEPSTI